MKEMSTHRIATALALVTALGASTACKREPPPPVDDTTRTTSAPVYTNDTTTTPVTPQAHTGITTGQKVVILAGAAAAYYMYKHHKAKAGDGPDGQYYLSKNGRVYYRDAQHRAHWVTPPPEGVRVPENEAREYREFRGYDNRNTGRDLTGLGNDE